MRTCIFVLLVMVNLVKISGKFCLGFCLGRTLVVAMTNDTHMYITEQSPVTWRSCPKEEAEASL